MILYDENTHFSCNNELSKVRNTRKYIFQMVLRVEARDVWAENVALSIPKRKNDIDVI